MRAGLPDWSGQWENVGATPDATGGFNQSLDQVLRTLQWGPPNKPGGARAESTRDRRDGAARGFEAVARGEDPGGAVRACTFGYPALMLDSPLMFEVLPTPKETALIFSSREIRHVYTGWITAVHAERRAVGHTAGVIDWCTGRGQTLVIDTIAVKSPFASSESGGVAVLAFGDVEGERRRSPFWSSEAHFIEANPNA